MILRSKRRFSCFELKAKNSIVIRHSVVQIPTATVLSHQPPMINRTLRIVEERNVFHLNYSQGVKALFIRGCSYYKKENEFLIAPSCFENIRLNKYEVSNDICSGVSKKIYDINVKPMTPFARTCVRSVSK